MKGKFIVIEGGDGAGKDTQIELLKKDFPDFVYTREPGGTPLGKVLREMVLHKAYGELPLLTEAFLFLADRAQHASEIVAPALEAGKCVVSNRSWISMMAYQVYGREQQELDGLVREAVNHIYKDAPISLVLILDVPVEVGIERQRAMGKALDTMESLPPDFHTRVRSEFLALGKELSFAQVIDANRSVEAVYADVKEAVSKCIQ